MCHHCFAGEIHRRHELLRVCCNLPRSHPSHHVGRNSLPIQTTGSVSSKHLLHNTELLFHTWLSICYSTQAGCSTHLGTFDLDDFRLFGTTVGTGASK